MTSIGIGMAHGSFASGWIVDTYGPSNGFWVCVAAGLLALMTVLFGSKGPHGQSRAEEYRSGPAAAGVDGVPMAGYLHRKLALTTRHRMKSVNTGILDVAYLEFGPAQGMPVILLHGFPYDVHAYDVVSTQLSAVGKRSIVPYLRGYGPTKFRSADTPRSGQQAALGNDLLAFMDALAIRKALLAGYDWGGRAACIVAALWPERVRGLVTCGAGYNIQNIPEAGNPVSPEEEHRYWYQYYFHSERGRAGLTLNRRDLCRLIWRLWSPTWKFDEEVFARTAAAFDNPDFVDIVIHSYRHRFGGIPGDKDLDGIEGQLAAQPDIAVPAIVLQGGDDGVDPPERVDRAAPHFTGRYERRITPGVGHNFPQEAPKAFVDAVLALA